MNDTDEDGFVTRITKLYERAASGGPLSFAEFTRLMEAFAFRLRRISGSHHIYAHASGERMNVQPDGKSAKAYQVRQFLVMIETAGIKLE